MKDCHSCIKIEECATASESISNCTLFESAHNRHDIEDLCSMGLHSSLKVEFDNAPADMYVVRVLGGWIYLCASTATFVKESK